MKLNMKFIGIILVVLVVVMLTAGCCSSSDSSTKTNGGGNTNPIEQTQDFVGHVGDSIESTSSTYHISWSVSQVIRGSQANSIVESGNMFNQKPDPGYEYLLYQVTVSNLDSDKYSIYPSTWTAYSNGVEAQTSYSVLPNSYINLGMTDLMSGASTSGWICVQVPTGSSVKIYFEPLFSYGNTQKVYIEV